MDPAADVVPVPVSDSLDPPPGAAAPEDGPTGTGTAVDGEPGAEPPARPPVEAAQPSARRSSRTKVLVGAVAAVAVAVLVLTVQPWSGAETNPAHPTTATRTAPAPTASSGKSSLAYTAATGTPQPPPTADPQSPGVLVDSGENRSDAFLYQANGRYYLYTSSTTSIPFLNVPVSSTTDFATWTPPKDAMVHLPAWAAEPFTWGPDVHKFGSHYVLYFTGFLKALDEQCIGAAFSSAPDGPFTAQARPFICQSGLSGSIDPRIFTDSDGTLYMQWKSDQNAHGSSTPTTLWSQRLGSDGLTLLGSPSALMQPDEPWQGTVIEAPDMVEVNGVYWLAYAANWFNQPAYGIGVAWCKGPLGPCADLSNQPLIGSNAQGKGPGEPSFFQDQSGVWMLYTPVESLPGDPPRPVYITRVGFTDKGAYLAAGGPPPALTPAPTSSAKRSAP
jgi:GH43 family beta-xylosidase